MQHARQSRLRVVVERRRVAVARAPREQRLAVALRERHGERARVFARVVVRHASIERIRAPRCATQTVAKVRRRCVRAPIANRAATARATMRDATLASRADGAARRRARSSSRWFCTLSRERCAIDDDAIRATSRRARARPSIARRRTRAKTSRSTRRSDDLWVIIDGKVYDLTEYADEHPGGADALARNAGGDATTGFRGPQHPSRVFDIVDDYLIGVLA